MIRVDPNETDPVQLYRYLIGSIVPRPIGWISTLSPGGVPNLAPFSYFNGVGIRPPTLCFSPLNRRDGSKKDTILNLESTPEFVANIVSAALGEAMNASSADLDYEESEFEKAGLNPIPSQKVKPPSVEGSPVQFECVVHQIVPIGEGPLAANLVIGRIVFMNIDEAVLDEDGQIDARKLDAIGRMGGDLYARTTDLFEMKRPS